MCRRWRIRHIWCLCLISIIIIISSHQFCFQSVSFFYFSSLIDYKICVYNQILLLFLLLLLLFKHISIDFVLLIICLSFSSRWWVRFVVLIKRLREKSQHRRLRDDLPLISLLTLYSIVIIIHDFTETKRRSEILQGEDFFLLRNTTK